MAPISINAEMSGSSGSVALPQEMGSAEVKGVANTTTISTIAVHSGQTKIVIAILRAGSFISIKILEIDPGIAYLGQSFEEAAELQTGHNEVIKNLQCKQSPVEDLLRQADGMIADQKPRAEVYSAMAESLGQAWRDLNHQLEQRKLILDQSYMFQGHLQDYGEVTNALEQLCAHFKVPSDPLALQEVIQELQKAKRTMLESSVYALQEGDALLELLQGMKSHSIMDSRPNFIRRSFLLAIGQVELWLEELHEHRIRATDLFEARMSVLRSQSGLIGIGSDLRELETLIQAKRRSLEGLNDLGSSTSTCDELLRHTMSLQNEAEVISGRCLEAVKASQGLNGQMTYMESSVKAYNLLEQAGEYQRLLDQRVGLLSQAATFFQHSQSVHYHMDQLELQIRNVDPLKNSQAAWDTLESIYNTLDQVVEDAAKEGDDIINQARGSDAKAGITAVLEQLKSRAANLKTMCNLKLSQVTRGGEALKSFVAKLEEFDAWIENVVQKFLETNKNLGQSWETSNFFLENHKDLVNKIHMKTFELEGLRGALKTISNQCSNQETKAVEQRMDQCNARLTTLMQVISQRLTIAEKYVKFQKLFEQVDAEMSNMKRELAQDTGRQSFEKSSWILIQQLLEQIKHLARNLVQDLGQFHDGSLDQSAAVDFVQSSVIALEDRHSRLASLLDKLDLKAKEGQKVEEEWISIYKEKRESIDFSLKIDLELFPIISGDTTKPEIIVIHLEEKLLQLPKQKLLSERFVQLIARVEDLWGRLPESKKPEAKKLVSDLRQKLKALQLLFIEYELILQMAIPFFKNYGELDHTMRNLLGQYKQGNVPNDVTEAELMAREHEAGRASLLEILRFAKRERDSIVKKIGEQKSKQLLEQDKMILERLLDTMEADFQRAWDERKRNLTKHAKFCLFATSLRQLSQDIHSLNETARIRTTLGETMGSVDAANGYLLEIKPTLEDIEQRINLCEYESKLIVDEMPVHQATVKLGMDQVQERWKVLQDLLTSQCQKLRSASDYFNLLEQSEKFSREANKALLEWSQRISGLENKSQAHDLKGEIERFIKSHRTIQNDIILRISSVAGQAFGEPTVQKTQIIQKEQNETFEALNSFFQQLEMYFTHEKSVNEEIARSQMIQAEAEANIRAARTEAEAAKRAAKQAEEARRRAEEASLKAKSEVKITKVICHETQTEAAQPQVVPLAEMPTAPRFVDYLQDKALVEGGRCDFRAKVTGHPVPQITWFKDGVAIRDNSDYLTTFESGLCSLTIEETFVDDSANWSVRASNPAGYAESHAKLTVKEFKPVEAQSPPTVVVPLSSMLVREGDPVELRCRTVGNPSPQVSWFKNGLCIDRSKNFTIGDHEGDNVLRIDKIAVGDDGTFVLKAFNHLGGCSSEAKLEVKSLQLALAPEFEVPLENVDVIPGDPILLECFVTGTPQPEVGWFHNNRMIKPSNDIQIQFNGSRASVTIKHAFPKVLGHYLCKAKNLAGEATSTATVTAKPIVPDTSDSEAMEADPVKRAKYKPAFRVPLKNVELAEGKHLMLECVIVASPEPDVAWFKDNFPISESSDVHLAHMDDHFQLFIKEVNLDQGGEFKVVATNALGDCQSTCSCIIVPKKKTSVSSTQTAEQSKERHSYSHSIAQEIRAPKFLRPIQSHIVDQGESIKFEGIVEGVPPPQTSWTFNGVCIRPSQQVKMVHQGQLVSLTLRQATRADSGQYACLAENNGGTSQCSAELLVQERVIAPNFVKKLRNNVYKEGDRIILDIEASGLPPPIVTWLKDGQELIPSHEVQFQQHGNHFSLIVLKAKVSDAGTYEVELSSPSGTARTQSQIEVKPVSLPAPKPQPRGQDMVLQSRALNTLSSWKGSDRELPELVPFPFKPDGSAPRRRNRGKVPKPSKFVPGEMYHSDYDTDWEGPLPPKWRPYCSDTEDLQYKQVRPNLDWNLSSKRPERKPSPPCPHQWESHDEIEQLEADLKKKSPLNVRSIKTSQLTNNIEEMQQCWTTQFNTTSSSTNERSYTRSLERLPKTRIPNQGEKPKIDGIFASVYRNGYHSDNEMARSSSYCDTQNKQDQSGYTACDQQLSCNLDQRQTMHWNQWQSSQTEQKQSFQSEQEQSFKSEQKQSFQSEQTQSFQSEQTQSSHLESNQGSCQLERDQDNDVTYYQSRTEVVERPSPVPPSFKTSALTPPSSLSATKANSPCGDEVSVSSQSTVRTQATFTSPTKKPKFVSVKEKVKILERKVEDYLSYDSEQSESRGGTPTLRPEEIPGAVCVLPVPHSPSSSRPHSRKSSIGRSSSLDHNAWYWKRLSSLSPVNTPGRELPRKTSLGTPPPMYIPPKPRYCSLTNLEPFPFKPDPKTGPRSRLPPPPSPSKFVQGKFRDSDYHSDLEGSIPAKWTPSGSLQRSYKPVHVQLPQSNTNQPDTPKSPTPPMHFEDPNRVETSPGTDQHLSCPSSLTSSTDSQFWNSSISTKNEASSYFSQSQFEHKFSSTSNTSSMDRAHWPHSKTTTDASEVQSTEDITPTNTLTRMNTDTDGQTTPNNAMDHPTGGFELSRSPRRSSPKTKKRHDGYEADTDDTLKRRKSVREIASSFQEAENACPSPRPIRPKGHGSESEYESDAEGRTSTLRRSTSKEPLFTKSRAYVPPKWAPTPSEAQSTANSFHLTESSGDYQRIYTCQQATQLIRFDNQIIANQPAWSEPGAHIGVFEHSMAKATNEGGSTKDNHKLAKTIPQFLPKKFIPRVTTGTEPTSWTFEDQRDSSQKIKAKWAPSDSETEEPCYRKIRPNLENDKSKQSGADMANQFRTKVADFRNKVAMDQSQAYSDSYQTSEKGSKQIDPDTGLVYFKYDFGYEFGLLVPGDGKDTPDENAYIRSMTGDLQPQVGTKVSIEVEVDRSCRVEWRWNHQPMGNDRRREFKSEGTKHALVIENVMTEDNGIYSCLAISSERTETKSCSLVVEGESLL